MMNLYEEIEKIKEQGYNEANAQSKLGQDIVLKAIYDSGMARNATIKGGVVMRSISGEVRRAICGIIKRGPCTRYLVSRLLLF